VSMKRHLLMLRITGYQHGLRNHMETLMINCRWQQQVMEL
jgi:hypothetical protein